MKAAKFTVHFVAMTFFLVTWIAGVVLAQGFWSTLISTFFFPWSWYLLIERIMQMTGFI